MREIIELLTREIVISVAYNNVIMHNIITHVQQYIIR